MTKRASAFLGSPLWVLDSVRHHAAVAPVGIVTIALICLARGLVLLPYLLLVPATFTAFNVVASAIWFIAGLGFASGAVRRWQQLQ